MMAVNGGTDPHRTRALCEGIDDARGRTQGKKRAREVDGQVRDDESGIA